MGVIYKATCSKTGKSYIGQTIRELEQRKREHFKAQDDYYFHTELRKYGDENFSWEIIEQCPNEKLNEREIYWIDYYDTYFHGYNETKGGDNAESLLNWKKTHKEEEHNIALDGLRYAQEWNNNHRDQHLVNLAKAREKAVQSCSKKICCIELNLVFNSLSEAESWSQTSQNPNGRFCSHQHISKVCKGKRKTAGGYTWKYIKEEK